MLVPLSIVQVLREGNMVEDLLSKHALGIPQSIWWSSVLSFCALVYHEDFSGKEAYRFS